MFEQCSAPYLRLNVVCFFFFFFETDGVQDTTSFHFVPEKCADIPTFASTFMTG